ncbi:MAG: hypothetical protein DRH12_02355 [Deltaproteobacteria bacterium]|nr:MAG: hypothetical protein DRH12_02355 [Deltaproteobacteria bacterium]RLB86997.1 MAG: hypothetical protein DRH15_00085 [Deltaproteobacteria bacterium]
MRYIKGIGVILFLLFIVIVAVQNYAPMSTTVRFRLNLLFWSHETPDMNLYLVTIIAFLLGVFFTGVYGIGERFRLKREIKNLTRELREKEKELNSLRNLPVTSEDVKSLEAVEGQ